MCGKYHITTEDENISFREALRKLMLEHPEIQLKNGDVLPSQIAPVITAQGLSPMRFGHRLGTAKRLFINARSETAAGSPLFAPRLKTSRCLVPASAFYEWSPEKKPFLFGREQGGLLHMAALYFTGADTPDFVIITRDAAGPPSVVHPRMPLIFGSPELQEAWLRQDSLAEALLHMDDGTALVEYAPAV